MFIDVVTLFPDFFAGPLATGLTGKAIESGAATVRFTEPRTFTHDRHHTVDATPYGGGGGMLMKVEPLAAAIEASRAKAGEGARVVLLTPQGRPLDQPMLERWSRGAKLILVCGRYEGFDERITSCVDEEVSLGDFVLTGGEYAALAIIDGVIRLRPGTLGNAVSHAEDSFSIGFLEGPHYTRPPEWRGSSVPEVLVSGNHAAIRAFHRAAGLAKTRRVRPELLESIVLDAKDRAALQRVERSGPRVELAIVSTLR